jgi:RimJ/RimL family protein N-acetyltransferase
LPNKALDWSTQDKNCHPVVILFKGEPVGFFVLHNSKETQHFTHNTNAIFLRSFFIDKKHQGKGLARSAMNSLPSFLHHHLPQVVEIILTVHEKNLPAKRLYEKSGFLYNGKSKPGRNGIELAMNYMLKGGV